jgi:hypothetical protein
MSRYKKKIKNMPKKTKSNRENLTLNPFFSFQISSIYKKKIKNMPKKQNQTERT